MSGGFQCKHGGYPMDNEAWARSEPNGSPVEARPRCLNLVDLAVVVAGCAVGLAIFRLYFWLEPGLSYRVSFYLKPGSGYSDAGRRLATTLGFIASVGPALTASVLVLRFRRPRPAWSVIRKQPGFIACLIVPASIAVKVPHILLLWSGSEFISARERQILMARVLLNGEAFGYVILISWIAMWALGGWKSEAGAIDRLGRAIGWGWIFIFVVSPLLQFWLI